MKTKLQDKRVFIRRLRAVDATELHALRLRNRAFLQPFEPLHTDGHFTYAVQLAGIMKSLDTWKQDSAYSFGIFLNSGSQLIGRVNLSNISRGAWQNCTIGYFMDKAQNGKGLTTEAVSLALEFAFTECGLHRVQAAIMPHNIASIRVVKKLGFQEEGIARYYLKINDVWEDHRIFSMTTEMWHPSED